MLQSTSFDIIRLSLRLAFEELCSLAPCLQLEMRLFKKLRFSSVLTLSHLVARQEHSLSLYHFQPELHPAPSLPSNFSIKPEHWRHATPLLQNVSQSVDRLLIQRQVSTAWSGWQDIHYLFALYVRSNGLAMQVC